jgi:hypothetical protein
MTAQAYTKTRAEDPVTSLAAARSVRLADSQEYVLSLFHAAGRPLADFEVTDLAVSLGCRLTAQRLRTARAELAEQGRLVLVPGAVKRTYTGHVARVWSLPKEAGS